MQNKEIKFLEESFKKYYFDHYDLIHVPRRTSEREFGFQKFNSGMTRHISLKDDKELHLLLMQNTPSDVYCSNAYYSFPNQPMNEKDWKEADLIFDIDAKDLHLDCRQNHSVTKCNECNQISNTNNYCSKCNSTKIETKSLACKHCIDGSKKEVVKLLNILVDDLDVEKNNIKIYFSGNEGFHVYAYDSQFQELGSRERSELVDYIMFRGTIPETFGMKKLKPNRSLFPEFEDKGWKGRFSKEILEATKEEDNIDPFLVIAIIQQESNCDPNVESNANSHGLMQVTEITFNDNPRTIRCV